MKSIIGVVVCGALALAAGGRTAGDAPRKDKTISFKTDVTPIFKKYCLPCHAGDSNNPSELFLDSYQEMMKGGEHGAAVIPGKPAESLLILKLDAKPPFGDPMPMNPRRKKAQTPPKRLTEEEIQVLKQWIEQGAKDN